MKKGGSSSDSSGSESGDDSPGKKDSERTPSPVKIELTEDQREELSKLEEQIALKKIQLQELQQV